MEICLFCLLVALSCFIEAPDQQTFVGSTSGHSVVSSFLGIASTDSIDFVRWKLEINANRFTLQCQYGLSKPSTPGFINEKRVAFEGGIGYRKETMERGTWKIITGKNGRIIYQVYPDKRDYTLYLLKGDNNILFFVDPTGRLLVGNEDFSYTLNRRKEEYAPIYR